ncbi:MAG: acyl carrier protein [Oscillospiraceae bacterium]|nr:acyl carrier protein [Oscillospiraceae bacterium]
MIFEKVCSMIAEQFGVDASTLSMDTHFEEDLSADSLDIVELTMALEEEFDIGEMEEEELANLRTIGDVVNYIQNQVN